MAVNLMDVALQPVMTKNKYCPLFHGTNSLNHRGDFLCILIYVLENIMTNTLCLLDMRHRILLFYILKYGNDILS